MLSGQQTSKADIPYTAHFSNIVQPLCGAQRFPCFSTQVLDQVASLLTLQASLAAASTCLHHLEGGWGGACKVTHGWPHTLVTPPSRILFPDKHVLPKRGFWSNKGQYRDFLCLTILFLFLLAKSAIPSGFFHPYL